jgi:hypothetical protein
LGLTHQLKLGGPSDEVCGFTGHCNRVINHCRKSFSPEGLKRDPEFQSVKSAAGHQGRRNQVRDAFFLVEFRVQVVSMQFDSVERSAIAD